MNMKSSYSEIEVCEYMINKMNDDSLKSLVIDNPSLRIKYGAFDKKYFKYEREKAINTAVSLSKSNKSLRESIIDRWKVKSNLIFRNGMSMDNIEDVEKYIKKDLCDEDMFLLAIELWRKPSSELNEYGDEIFKNCLSNKYKSKDERKVKKMNCETSNVLSMNLAECIEAISNYDAKIKEYEEKLKAKDEVIKELREQLKVNGDSKELKKEVAKLGRIVQTSSSEIKSYNDNTEKEVERLKTELSDIKNEVSRQFKNNESNNKLLINEFTKIITDFRNTITSSVVDENRKLIKFIKESVVSQINYIKEETVCTDQQNETEELQDFPEDIDNLLGDILTGIFN